MIYLFSWFPDFYLHVYLPLRQRWSLHCSLENFNNSTVAIFSACLDQRSLWLHFNFLQLNVFKRVCRARGLSSRTIVPLLTTDFSSALCSWDSSLTLNFPSPLTSTSPANLPIVMQQNGGLRQCAANLIKGLWFFSSVKLFPWKLVKWNSVGSLSLSSYMFRASWQEEVEVRAQVNMSVGGSPGLSETFLRMSRPSGVLSPSNESLPYLHSQSWCCVAIL